MHEEIVWEVFLLISFVFPNESTDFQKLISKGGLEIEVNRATPNNLYHLSFHIYIDFI